MKIAYIAPSYSPNIGGIEKRIESICGFLSSKGHTCTVLTLADRHNPVGLYNKPNKNIKVIRFKSLFIRSLSPKILEYIKQHKFDIVHIHNFHSFFSLLPIFLKRRDFILIMTLHYHNKSNIRHLILRIIFKMFVPEHVDYFVSVSTYEKSQLIRSLKIPQNKIELIPNGIPIKELNLTNFKKFEFKFILYVGRIEEYKGVLKLLDIMIHLPYYKLVIIGSGSCEETLNNKALHMGIKRNVVLLKKLPYNDLVSYYLSARAFVNLSNFESYGITVAEALASGTPCVVNESSAMKTFVDGKSCVGVNNNTPAKRIANIIENLPFHVKDYPGLLSNSQVNSKILKLYERFHFNR